MHAGLLSTVLSSIERRYHFSSTAAGFILSAFEISVVLVVVFVSYLGGRGHVTKWLGTGCILQGIGCLIFMSPQFILFRRILLLKPVIIAFKFVHGTAQRYLMAE